MKAFVCTCVGLLLFGCSRVGADSFPVTIVGKEVYNAYDARITWVVRVSDQQVDEIIRTQPRNPLALFVATTRGDLQLVRALLQKGADPNHKTDFGHYPIHEAAREGNVDILDALVAAGANMNVRISAKGSDGPNQWTALHFAAFSGNVTIAMKLLDGGAEMSPRDFWGRTPLYYATQQKHQELAALLIRRGAIQ